MTNPFYPRLLAAGGLLLVAWLGGRYLLPLLMPFLLGGGLALLSEPVVRFLTRRLRLPRSVASGIGVSITFCLLASALLRLGAALFHELGVLAGILPDLGSVAKTGITALGDWLQGLALRMPGALSVSLSARIREFFSGGTALLDKAVGYVLSLAGGMLSRVPDSALGLGTGLISSFMISAKLPAIRRRGERWRESERLRPWMDLGRQLRTAFGGWLLAQAKLSGITWAILTGGFLLLRISLGPLWAFLTALVDAFPVLGTGTVLLPWSLICLLQGDRGRGIGLLGLYALVSLTRSILEPRLVGRHLGVDPLVTLAALYVGYKLWGLPGLILAPSLAMLAVRLIPGPREPHS